jgi:hypothetical protein
MKPFLNVVRELRATVSRQHMQPGGVYNKWEFVFTKMRNTIHRYKPGAD